jgi:radical SAM superfamily enzyme YgiQ (UPF0313 family)
MSTDVAFIHPGGVHGIFSTELVESSLVAREQPLWCRICASYLLDRGYTCAIVDQEVSIDDVSVLIEKLDPKIVVIVAAGHQPSASTQSMVAATKIADSLQGHTTKLVIMGNHPSALPERTLRSVAVDYVIDGEGPATILGLLKGDKLENIPGLVWFDEFGDVIRNPAASLLDLDHDLHGSSAWHLLPPPSRYMAHQWQCLDDLSRRTPYAAIHTSLGCSFKCHFCMINVFQHTNRYRMRSPAAVVEEMETLYRDHGVKTFKIIDELFVLNKRHFRAVCAGLAASIGPDINVWAYSRTDTVTEEDLPILRAAGIKWLALGIESSDAGVQAAAAKTQKVDIRAVVRQIQAADISVIGNYIFGLPEDTGETMQATLDLALSLGTEWANFYVALPYPGSPLFDEVQATRPQDLPPAWEAYSQHNPHTYPLSNANLSAAEILAFRDQAFLTFFTDPSFLARTAAKFGCPAVDHVRDMTRYRLRRNLLETPE